MELELIEKNTRGKTLFMGQLQVGYTLSRRMETSTIGSTSNTYGDGWANVKSKPRIWKYMFGLVLLSLLLSAVDVILAAVALQNGNEHWN